MKNYIGKKTRGALERSMPKGIRARYKSGETVKGTIVHRIPLGDKPMYREAVIKFAKNGELVEAYILPLTNADRTLLVGSTSTAKEAIWVANLTYGPRSKFKTYDGTDYPEFPGYWAVKWEK